MFREESPDVFNNLPETYLPDYKSSCWEDTASGNFHCLPGLYLAGMPKCGSTDLFDKLVWHPDLWRPGFGKESHYWTRLRLGAAGAHTVNLPTKPTSFKSYLGIVTPRGIRGNHGAVLVDGTQSLLWDLDRWEGRHPGLSEPPYTNAELIHAVTPNATVLVVLRDPTERLFSDYLYFNNPGWGVPGGSSYTATSFREVVESEVERFERCVEQRGVRHCCYSSENSRQVRLHLGIYLVYLRDWWARFGGRIKVVSLERFSRDPVEVLLKTYLFAGVPAPGRRELETFLGSSGRKNTRPRSQERKGKMLPETADRLRKFYEPYNEELQRFYVEHPDILI